MAVVHFATTVKDNILEQIRAAINAGAAGGKIKIYDGTMPTLPTDAVTTQQLLGTLTFAVDCGTVSAGVLNMASITQDNEADHTGNASWARITDSNDNVVMDVNASVTGGSGVIQMNTVAIVELGPILISAFVISVP